MGRWNKRKYIEKLKARQKAKEAAFITAAIVDNEEEEPASPGQEEEEDDILKEEEEEPRKTSLDPPLPGWKWRQRKQICAFLNAYRRGCECHHAGLLTTKTKIPSFTNSNDIAVRRRDHKNDLLLFESGMIIDTVQFPALTLKVFQQPYLALPTTLTTQNRKIVHQCCVETFLFHATVGEKRSTTNPKTLLISIYANAFEHFVPNFLQIHTKSYGRLTKQPPPSQQQQQQQRTESLTPPKNKQQQQVFYHPPIHQYRPWYALRHKPWHLKETKEEDSLSPLTRRQEKDDSSSPAASTLDPENGRETPIISNTSYRKNDDFPTKTTQKKKNKNLETLTDKGKKLVDAMIDNPERCLRDELDVLDFSYWDKKDLSDIPPPGQEGWTLIDSAEKMKDCAKTLLHSANPPITELAFDLELLNKSKYSQLTCLLQITTDQGHDYVIDTLAPGVWDEVGPALAPLFANPRIVKVGHSVGGLDIKSLHRDFGIFCVNVFDTYEAAQVLRLPSHGLAFICQYYGMQNPEHYKDLKDKYQTADWRLRPLTDPMLEYGRFDVHYLLRLRWLMMRDLTRANLYDVTTDERDEEALRFAANMAQTFAQFNEDEDKHENDDDDDDDSNYKKVKATPQSQTNNGLPHDFVIPNYNDDDSDSNGVSTANALSPDNSKASAALLRMQPLLMKVLSQSAERCRDLWSGRAEPMNHDMLVCIKHQEERSGLRWTESARFRLYERLLEWRNLTAREREILPGFVAPLEFLIAVALQRPTSEAQLCRVTLRFPELLQEDEACRQTLFQTVRHSLQQEGKDEEDEGYLLEFGKKPNTAVRAKLLAKYTVVGQQDDNLVTKSLVVATVLTVVVAAVSWTALQRRKR